MRSILQTYIRAADLGDRLADVDQRAAQVVDDGLLRALGVAEIQAGSRGALPQGQRQQALPGDDVAAAEGAHGGPREQLPLQEGSGGERARGQDDCMCSLQHLQQHWFLVWCGPFAEAGSTMTPKATEVPTTYLTAPKMVSSPIVNVSQHAVLQGS